MTNYEIKMTFAVEADSKIEAADKLSEFLGGLINLNISSDVEADLFAELGVDYGK